MRASIPVCSRNRAELTWSHLPSMLVGEIRIRVAGTAMKVQQAVVTAQEGKPALGAAIFAGLTTYAMLAKRRRREHLQKASTGRASDARGRAASSPAEIPRRGWWDIVMRTKDDVSRNNLSLIAAGAAFYAFLAIPSAITALVSLYGLMFDPDGVQRQVEALHGVLPDDAIKLLSDQLHNLAAHSNSTLGAG